MHRRQAVLAGNDAQLLSQEFSLSVDEVDGSPSSAWNLAPAGVLGAAALQFYLSKTITRSNHFSIRLGTIEGSTG